MQAEYGLSKEEVFSAVESSETGLSTQEAQNRLEKYGANKLKEAEKATWLQKFMAHLKDPMLIILMIAAAVSALTGMLSRKDSREHKGGYEQKEHLQQRTCRSYQNNRGYDVEMAFRA